LGKPRKYLNERELSAYWICQEVLPDGRRLVFHEGSNIIVDSIGVLIAGLILGHPPFLTATPNLFMAWGSGDSAWDILLDNGKSNEAVTNTQLVNETFREPLQTVEFLDNLDVCTNTPTDRLEFMGRLSAGENPTQVREFGIFGGDASLTANSGQMMNHIIIPLRDRSISAPLDEYIARMTF